MSALVTFVMALVMICVTAFLAMFFFLMAEPLFGKTRRALSVRGGLIRIVIAAAVLAAYGTLLIETGANASLWSVSVAACVALLAAYITRPVVRHVEE